MRVSVWHSFVNVNHAFSQQSSKNNGNLKAPPHWVSIEYKNNKNNKWKPQARSYDIREATFLAMLCNVNWK